MNKPMKDLNERQLKELLTMNDIVEAPIGLAEQIKAEIPEDFGATIGGLAEPENVTRFPGRRMSYRALALAATLMAVVGASFLSYRLAKEPDAASIVADQWYEDDVAESAAAPAGGSSEVLRRQRQDLQKSLESQKREASGDSDPEIASSLQASEITNDLASLGYANDAEEMKKRVKSKLEGRRNRLIDLGSSRDEGRVDAADQDVALRGASPRVEAEPQSPFASPPPPPPAAPARPIVPASSAREQSAMTMFGQEAARRQAAPSTGGNAEPNDAPYGDVFFDSAGVNPFVDTEDDALSTFGLDVDTGSYTIARRFLREGHVPPPESVRVEEYVNYFDYGDPPPAEGDFAIHAEGAPSIFGQNDNYYLMRFNIRGRDIDLADRAPAHLVFVVDVSGSMNQENRLGLVKKALGLLLDQLRDDDLISLVVYGSRGRVVLEPSSNRGAIRRAIDGLHPEGSTNAEEGLRLAYELAVRHFRAGAINRVILCSDGVANVGNTSADSILDAIRSEADRGIELTTVGFGMGNYNDTMMERLADTGNGRYAYVDTLDEARRIFVEDLTGTLQTIAAEARVQVEFNPEVVSRYRLLGYENRDIADERFRDDSVDAGEIGAGHTVTALYEIKLERPPRRRDEIGTLHLRWGSAASAEVEEISHTVTGRDFAATWDQATPALRLTSLVAEFAELLKKTYWSKGGELDGVFFRAQKVSAEFAGDRKVADFVSLVGEAAELSREE